jgi:hypothetical protein
MFEAAGKCEVERGGEERSRAVGACKICRGSGGEEEENKK